MATEEERAKYGKNYCGRPSSPPWPKDKEHLKILVLGAYAVGKQDGIIVTAHQQREDKTAVESRVLDALVKLATANAQLGEAVSRALQSAKGQL